MSGDIPLEYKIYLSRHGRLSGELAVTGMVTDKSKDSIERRIMVHSCMVNGEMIEIRKNAERMQQIIRGNIAQYGDYNAISAYVESVFLEGDPFDCRKNFPMADICMVEGNMGVVASDEMVGAFAFSSEVIRALGPLVHLYETQYNQGSIDFPTMKHIGDRIWLPAYWFCTRRVEKLRRLVRESREYDDLDAEIFYGQKLEWWTKLMSKE